MSNLGSATTEPGVSDVGVRVHPTGFHRVANRALWPWLPTQNCGHLAPHPYCRDCGEVKALGTGRALDIGGLVNLIARLSDDLRREGRRVTEVQRRLIMKELLARGADDSFGLERETQLRVVSEVCAKYLAMTADTAETFVRSC